ncbi:MAG: tetratricopeptide repeat protein [Candidatus Heimdallarchaeota archaeon]
MTQNITENEVKELFNQIEEYLSRYMYKESWDLLSPLLDKRNLYPDALAADISIYAAYSSLGMSGKDKSQSKALLEEGLELAKTADSQTGEAMALNVFGLLTLKEGDPGEALKYCERARSILEDIDDTKHLGKVYHHLMYCFAKLGQLSKALSYESKAFRLYQSEGNKWRQFSSLNELAGLHYEAAHFQEAIAYSRKAAELAEHLGDSKFILKSNFLEGVVLKRQGQLVKAKNFFLEAIEKYEDMYEGEVPPGVLRGHFYNLANVYELLGELGKAKAIYAKLLEEEQQTGKHYDLCASLGLGRLAVAQADFEEAARFIEDALTKNRPKKGKGKSLYLAEQLVLLSTVYVELADFEKAQHLLEEAESLELESRYTKIVGEYGKGFLAQAERNFRAARESFELCLDLAVEVGLAEYRIKALFHLASLELYEYRISGSRNSLESMQTILDDAYAIALDSDMPVLSIEIGILRGLSCSAKLDFECAAALFEENLNKARDLGLTTRTAEIEALLREVQETRKKAAELTDPEAILADSKKLSDYIGNLQNVIRMYQEGQDAT